MTLSSSALKEALRPFFVPATMPIGGGAEVVQRWATAYASYAQAAVAGAALPSPLAPVGSPGPFFDALDSSLRAMWMAVAWAGPGLVGTTTLVPPLAPVLRVVSAVLLVSRDPELALSRIADALHTYTLGITVTVVTPPGASTVVPLT